MQSITHRAFYVPQIFCNLMATYARILERMLLAHNERYSNVMSPTVKRTFFVGGLNTLISDLPSCQDATSAKTENVRAQTATLRLTGCTTFESSIHDISLCIPTPIPSC